MVEKDLYKLLGVRSTARPEEIRSAYRRLLRYYHPDVYKGDPEVATLNTREITAAYEVLSDPDRRREYDRERTPASSRTPGGPRRATSRPPSASPSSRSPGASRAAGPPVPDEKAVPVWLLRERQGPRAHDLDAQLKELVHHLPRIPRRFQMFLVVLLALITVGLVIGYTVPVTRTFVLDTSSSDGLSYVCDAGGQDFVAGAQVAFDWRSNIPEPSSLDVAPDIVLNGPAGGIVYAHTSYNGNFSFVAQAGTYDFQVWGCANSGAIVTFSGQYTSPLI